MTFAIAVAVFYQDLAERLVTSATMAFTERQVEMEVFEVPGAFELPLAASYAARSGRFAGVACLGAVIRGETDHYDFVCAQAAAGVMRVQLDTGVPCAFGVLTCETIEQALARAGGDRSRETRASGANPRFGQRDTGRHAAETVMRMAALRGRFASG
jgi:6,7-dimethyl-8-ribityllumazine synthase